MVRGSIRSTSGVPISVDVIRILRSERPTFLEAIGQENVDSVGSSAVGPGKRNPPPEMLLGQPVEVRLRAFMPLFVVSNCNLRST